MSIISFSGMSLMQTSCSLAVSSFYSFSTKESYHVKFFILLYKHTIISIQRPYFIKQPTLMMSTYDIIILKWFCQMQSNYSCNKVK